MIEHIKDLMNPYKVKNKYSKREITGDWLKIIETSFTLNNNQAITRDVLVKPHNHSAIIIPETIDKKYVMVIQPRPATEKEVTIEFPAGYINETESIEDGVSRELLEETGYKPQNINTIATFFQDVGCSNAQIHVFQATGCQKIDVQHLDQSEMITFIEVSYEELIELYQNNMIVDANTLICILYLMKEHK